MCSVDFGDVVERELAAPDCVDPQQSEVREQVSLAAKKASEVPWTPTPEQPLPRQQHLSGHGALRQVVGLPKFTFGTCLASAGAWKNGYSLKPNILAVRFDGNWPRDVLYAWTTSL